MSTHILGSTHLKHAVIAYRRLPTPKKVVIWVGLSICVIFIFHNSRASTSSGGPPRPPHRGPPLHPPTPPSSPQEKLLWEGRKADVQEAFQHAYGGYEQLAFGTDELRPLSKSTQNNLNGWGATIIDSLDTMLMMDLAPEFDRAMEFVEKIDFTKPHPSIGFFETTIRYVGGLLSAYHLTSVSAKPKYRDSYAPILLEKAEELGNIMNGAFHTQSGLPDRSVKVENGHGEPQHQQGAASLAEMATCQMEFKYLSHLTKDPKYFTSSQKVIDIMQKEQGRTHSRVKTPGSEELTQEGKTGLWTNEFYLTDGKMFGIQVSAGAMGDSAYEYLLKQYLLSGRTEKHILDMYLEAMDGIINHLLYLSPKNNLLYMTDLNSWATPSGQYEHLSCYIPGVLALGARLLDPSYPWPQDPPNARSQYPSNVTSDSEYQPPYSHRLRPRAPIHIDEHELRQKLDLHMRAAKGLAYTCWALYASSKSGIGSESVVFNKPDLPAADPANPWLTRDGYTSAQWAPRVAAWERSGRKGELVGTEEEAGRNMGKWSKDGGTKKESGVIPEGDQDWYWRDQRYMLRPEAIEAMYLLWKTTGESKWRERGWKMFDAVNRHTRSEFGYTSVRNANSPEPYKVDEMPSFFLAETLKYSYLLTIEPEDDPLPLDQIVFNTEAHPLPVFEWTAEEKSRYNIH